MTTTPIYLSVVLPVYDCAPVVERHLPLLLNCLAGLGVSYEVILVDDGSRDADDTQRVAADHGCRFLGLPYNRGKGAAVRAGMQAASGRFCIYTDADIPFEVEVIANMLRYLDFKEFDMVAGDRTLAESEYFARVSWPRRVGSCMASFVVGRFVTTGWFDTQCGIKGFRDDIARDLFGVSRIERFAFDVELFYLALKRNYDIKRVPVRLRCNDTSSVRPAIDGLAFIRDILRIRINQARGRYRKTAINRRSDGA